MKPRSRPQPAHAPVEAQQARQALKAVLSLPYYRDGNCQSRFHIVEALRHLAYVTGEEGIDVSRYARAGDLNGEWPIASVKPLFDHMLWTDAQLLGIAQPSANKRPAYVILWNLGEEYGWTPPRVVAFCEEEERLRALVATAQKKQGSPTG